MFVCFMTKNRGKQLASNRDSLDIELIVKLGKDCREMAFMGQCSKSRSDHWEVGDKARQREVKLRMMNK